MTRPPWSSANPIPILNIKTIIVIFCRQLLEFLFYFIIIITIIIIFIFIIIIIIIIIIDIIHIL